MRWSRTLALGVAVVTLAACGGSPGPGAHAAISGVDGVPASAWSGGSGRAAFAVDETSGRVYAVDPAGQVITLMQPALPVGGDIGVESAGFVPPRAAAAYLADRFSARNKHPGDNAILRLSAAQLAQAGIRAGDLLIATEGGARTIDIRCSAACTVRYVAAGPAIAHAGGHIAFAPS